jgi:hypothetical protein
MSMTSFRSDAYNMGVDILKMQALLRRGTPATVANVATANATDLATAQALANQLKTTLNALLTELRTGKVIG